MTETDERVILTVEQAIAMLPDKEYIHTLIQCGMSLLGADWSVEEVREALRNSIHIELSGKTATSMGHGLAFWRGAEDDGTLVFLETKVKKYNKELEKYRVRVGIYASDETYGNNGAFVLPGPRGIKLFVIASNGAGWEHVSVSRIGKSSVPYWDEMCFIKAIFWEDEETVMQLHPPASHYVNNHSGVLHLWRPLNDSIPLPPEILVGIKSLGRLA